MAEPQRTLLLVKPDGVQRQLVGRVITRFEERGLKIVGLKLVQVDRALAEQHYAVHREKPFFRGPRGLHHLGPARRRRPGGPERDRHRPGDERRHPAARGRPGLDPWRPRRRDRAEPRPRLGQPRERRRGARPLVPPRGAAQLRAGDRPLGPRPRGVPTRRPAQSLAGPEDDRRGLRGRVGDAQRAPARQGAEDRRGPGRPRDSSSVRFRRSAAASPCHASAAAPHPCSPSREPLHRCGRPRCGRARCRPRLPPRDPSAASCATGAPCVGSASISEPSISTGSDSTCAGGGSSAPARCGPPGSSRGRRPRPAGEGRSAG